MSKPGKFEQSKLTAECRITTDSSTISDVLTFYDQSQRSTGSNPEYPKGLCGSPMVASRTMSTIRKGIGKSFEQLPDGSRINNFELTGPNPHWKSDIMGVDGLVWSVDTTSDGAAPDYDRCRDIAIGKACRTANSPDWDWPQDLGELGSTVKTIVDLISAAKKPLKTLRKLEEAFVKAGGVGLKRATMKELQKLKLPEAGHLMNILQDSYLCYQYGLLPILRSIMDAQGVCKAAMNDSKWYRRTSRGSYLQRYTTRTTWSCRDSGSGYNWKGSGMFAHYQTSILRARCTVTDQFNLDLVSNMDGRMLAGLSRINIPRAAYNITMFSFVVDWFVDLSAALSQFTEVPTFVAQRLVTVSVKTETERTIFPSAYASITRGRPGEVVSVREMSFPASVERHESYVADVYPGIPSFLPRWNPKLNKRKILDLLLFFRNFVR